MAMVKGKKRSSKSIGFEGEEIAAKFLKNQGYKILEKNYRTKFGEIDVIAMDHETLAFIEVKLRRGRDFGFPSESVDHKKRWQISKVAKYFLSRKGMGNTICRFDTVSIFPSSQGIFQCELIKDAFRYN